MSEQGCGKETTPDTLAIVDRLAGLSKVIPPAVMEQALLDTGKTGFMDFRVPFIPDTLSC
ncbi:MAG: hypothetical protein ACP5XB_21215 [Isosphaeraceae bacterium]